MDEYTSWVRDYMEPGERILWQGRPERIHLLDKNDIFLIPFSLFWGGFAIFWELTVICAHAPLMFPIVGAFFVLMGLHMIFGRFIIKALSLRSSCYVITGRKVLIRVRSNIRVFQKRSLPTLSIRRYADGTGSIALEASGLFSRWASGSTRNGMDFRTIFGVINELHGVQKPERVLQYLYIITD